MLARVAQHRVAAHFLKGSYDWGSLDEVGSGTDDVELSWHPERLGIHVLN